jgi:anti-anti-sigma factor
MDMQSHTYHDVLLLSLSGRANHDSSDRFRERLMPLIEAETAEYQKIVLDMSNVEYMSSVGLRVLMLAAKTSKKLDRLIVVAGLHSTMKEIFEISRFNMVFKTYDAVGDALAAVSAQALAAYSGGARSPMGTASC